MSTGTAPLALGPPLQVRSAALAHVGPNWFTTVMGTGIVGTALATLPAAQGRPALQLAATGAWVLAAVLLVTVAAATAAHWALHPAGARRTFDDPVMLQALGAPPMALMTVGAGALLLGPALLGPRLAVAVDVVLWSAGTVAGLLTAVLVPLRVLRRHRHAPVTGAWLMPVVPPMVSAATGALLVPHAPAGEARLVLLLACYALFGIALAASLVVVAALAVRLARHGAGAPAVAPTLWIVLGPLGQSVTAAGTLGTAAESALPPAAAQAAAAAALLYGVPVWGATLLWAVLAAAVTVRAARRGMPFGLSWWAFTFPVGTVVTGTGQLALHSGSTVLVAAATAGWVLLLAAWVVVGARTLRGVADGSLLAPAR
ncbi:tellurite resistance protein TehA-like permease [Kineococcus xinjiangensis]|uniref:Tellurite resistance protein TehA-like permease n=1 Tax=Kineococcus xinjiangensis TaxID=512762 RepID=A0A2S6IVJ9_9ACTN|nr:hypothetical protein [Kineococcus xinjiangensis]PPK98219.1 tellurite resistance protein TehA-like permease [Kineococcus xinjiangensis]